MKRISILVKGLTVIIFFVICFLFIKNISIRSYSGFENVNIDSNTAEYPPMIMFEDKLYQSSSILIPQLEKDLYQQIGSVLSCVSSDKIPNSNYQCNDDMLGCNIYISSDYPDYIFIKYLEHYNAYVKVNQ